MAWRFWQVLHIGLRDGAEKSEFARKSPLTRYKFSQNRDDMGFPARLLGSRLYTI